MPFIFIALVFIIFSAFFLFRFFCLIWIFYLVSSFFFIFLFFLFCWSNFRLFIWFQCFFWLLIICLIIRNIIRGNSTFKLLICSFDFFILLNICLNICLYFLLTSYRLLCYNCFFLDYLFFFLYLLFLNFFFIMIDLWCFFLNWFLQKCLHEIILSTFNFNISLFALIIILL